MSEYSDVIQNYLGASRAQVVSGLEDNPDDAAKAVELSHDTGVPSQIIAPDLEGFQKDYRANLATNLVMNNPALTAYVNSHPMAASVSNDDWGTLDSISNGLHRLRQATDILTAPLQGAISGAMRGGAEGLKEGWGEEPLAPVTGEQTRQAIPALDPSRGLLPGMENTLATSMLNLGSIALRAMSSAFEAGTSAVGGAVTGLTGSESLGREAKALSEYEMIKPEFTGHPWMSAGHEPPAGVIPELDKSKAERNESLLKGLEDVTKEVQKSTTWERSPELFKQFVQQHLADRQISIAGDAVTALYGDKVPCCGFLYLFGNILKAFQKRFIPFSFAFVQLRDHTCWRLLSRCQPRVSSNLRLEHLIFSYSTEFTTDTLLTKSSSHSATHRAKDTASHTKS